MKIKSSLLLKIIPKKINQQIFIILTFLVIPPLVTLGMLLISVSKNTIKDSIANTHQEIVARATGEIREHVLGVRKNVLLLASTLSAASLNAWQQQVLLNDLTRKQPSFVRIIAYHIKKDSVITSFAQENINKQRVMEMFNRVRSGKSYISEVDYGPDYLPFITFAEPISQLGQVVGVVVADFSLRGVWDIIDAIHVGKTGRAYLIDKEGHLMAHQDKKIIFQRGYMVSNKIKSDLLKQQRGFIEEVVEGKRWLTTYAPIQTFGWGLFISQSAAEVFGSLRLLEVKSLILLVLALAIMFLVAYLLARLMTGPIEILILGMKRISAGDFSHRFPVKGRYEVSRLFFVFNQMTRRLRKAQEVEKLSIVGKAAASVAHELKNSLQLVDTFVKLLPQRYKDKKFIQDFNETIPKELDSWQVSLRNMMTFAKNETFIVKEVDLHELFVPIILLVSLKAKELGINFQHEFTAERCVVIGNEDKLKQVFLNLLTNALEATPLKGCIELKMNVLLARFIDVSSSVEVTVINTGEVISQEDQERIFEPFYSLKKGGLGLGLAICKEIVYQHHGTITVTTPSNSQTAFTVRFPRVEAYDYQQI